MNFLSQVSPNYETLNGVRGVAAISVAIFHTHSRFWPQQAASGTLAVDIFFVLSGFVLAGAYGDRIVSGRLSLAQFVKKRILRFYPLYSIGTMLGLAQFFAQKMSHSPNARVVPGLRVLGECCLGVYIKAS